MCVFSCVSISYNLTFVQSNFFCIWVDNINIVLFVHDLYRIEAINKKVFLNKKNLNKKIK